MSWRNFINKQESRKLARLLEKRSRAAADYRDYYKALKNRCDQRRRYQRKTEEREQIWRYRLDRCQIFTTAN